MKRVWAIVFILMLSCAALAEATPIFKCEGYVYTVDARGNAEIVCWDGPEADLAIPGELDGRPVTGISECAFADCPYLESVILPQSVTSIGAQAFVNCPNLAEVYLPDGLKQMGPAVFEGCEGLTAIYLPAGLSRLTGNPFKGCENLWDIQVSEDNPHLYTRDGALFTRADDRLVCYPLGLPTTDYRVPEGTRAIGAQAFSRDLYLQSVAIPESVVSIEPDAFDGCAALQTLDLPLGRVSVGGNTRLTLLGR